MQVYEKCGCVGDDMKDLVKEGQIHIWYSLVWHI